MMHRRFILRQLRRSRKQGIIFITCVMLSVVTLVALNGFAASVHQALQKDARKLHAGDIILKSRYPFSAALKTAVKNLERNGIADSVRMWEFYSVVRTVNDDALVLSRLKIAGTKYPFYGSLVLGSGRSFAEKMRPGTVIVDPAVLTRMNLEVGAAIEVGDARLIIADTVLKEPDRPVTFFSFGPRVFVHPQDLEALDLVKKGSRIWHRIVLKIDDGRDIDQIAADLSAAAIPEQERVDTYRTANTRIQRFFDNFLFFLNMVAVFTLLLAGFGIQSALTAFLKDQEYTMAIAKTVGATSHFVVRHYLVIVSLLGAVGTLAGIALGLGLQLYLPRLFAGILPADLRLTIPWQAVAEGMLLGCLVVALFAYMPLHRLKEVRPTVIFRYDPPPSRAGLAFYLSLAAIAVFFTIMILLQLRDLKLGIYFLAGIVGFVAVTAGIIQAVIAWLRRRRPRQLAARQSLKGLFRPRNATRAILITLTASLAVIFSIYLVEKNLDAAFVKSFPPDAPNVFFIDIQPDQVEAFSRIVDAPRYYPIVRARVAAINGDRINRRHERKKRGDNLGREFNLTYRRDLLEDEEIIEGDTLFRTDWTEPQVSVMDTVVDMREMHVGDRISFNIQGIPITARISSIRTRARESLKPFFYFILEPKTLEKAPQTIFTAVRVDKDRIPELQNRVVSQFPNISVLDITETATVFSTIMERLSTIVRFFALFSIAAGLLIMISTIFATRAARIRESVYYKILGATRGFVLKVYTLENAFLGGISTVIAMITAQSAGFLICTRYLDIHYRFFPMESAVLLLAPIVIVIGVGLSASRSILAKKPIAFLREHGQG